MVPFVSIIIPYFKAKDTIVRAIESVLKQTDPDWELLVVDDGSNDGLGEVMLEIDNSKVKLYQKENSGPSDSRNYGVEMSSGRFLSFLDSDDWLAPNWLERFKVEYLKAPFEVAYCFGALIDEITKEKVEWRTLPKFQIQGQLQALNNLVGTFMVSRELFELSGKFDSNLRYSENMDLALRILDTKPFIVKSYIADVLVFFGNTTNPKSRNSKYGRKLLLKDLGYFQRKNSKLLNDNPDFLRNIIRRQLVSATVCFDVSAYFKKLIELFSYSLKDGVIYLLLLFFFPLNYLRLKGLGFRK